MSIELPELNLSVSHDQQMAFHGELALNDYEEAIAQVEQRLGEYRQLLEQMIVEKDDPLEIQALSRTVREAEKDRELLRAAGADLRMSVQMNQTRISNVMGA